MSHASFELDSFLPYLLNQAAERTGKQFEQVYRDTYGLTRTGWRIVSQLGTRGEMTAAQLSRLSHTEKTKVSRTVSMLEAGGLVLRLPSTTDRRTELLRLTDAGQAVLASLSQEAAEFDRRLRARIGKEAAIMLAHTLGQLAAGAITPKANKASR